MRKAMYAFSGDPITYGHIDIIERVSKAFDKVVVGIGANPDKKYMFNLGERTEMAKRSLANINNVEVTPFNGLLVDYAYENKVSVIVKGVRNNADFDYENILHQVGESQKLNIDTHILFARPELAHISSSVVKAIHKENGLIHDYVTLYVKQCIESKMSNQYIVGVTGEMGVGKSYICKKFEEFGEKKGINVHNIELDQIPHKIYDGTLKEERYNSVRQDIIKLFGKEVELSDGSINRKYLGNIVFNNIEKLNQLNNIMAKPIEVRLKRELYGKKGLILLNAALIAESNMAYLSNNNMLLVHTNKETQKSRLKSRGLDEEQIKRRLESQYNSKEKISKLEQAIKKNNQGKIWSLDNSEGLDDIEKIFGQIILELKIK